MAEKKVKKISISDFDDESKEQMKEQITANAKRIGADEWEGIKHYRAEEDIWGICATCQSFQFCRTEFDKMFARCSDTRLILNQKDRMTECTMFTKIGEMDLRDMQQIAWYINSEKRKIGF